MFDTVAIVGVGLIGGSFGLALKKAGFTGRILGVSSAPALEAALARGAIDEGLPLEEAVPRADLVYLSQPIHRILETIERLDPLLRPGALVSDAGSTKARIVEQGRRSIRRGQFLGGHPMAGKETRGAAEADAGLFSGRTYVLTPSDPAELETAAAREFLRWLTAIGAVPVTLGPAGHDRIVACTSHLPQLLSTALAAMLGERLAAPDDLRVAGPGLADMTRLAASPYEVWGDILDTNRATIEAALDACIAELSSLRNALGAQGAQEVFQRANQFAARLRQHRQT
ncbi:MAG: prephenate dehydrogenase [Acidobacteria bacterium]|nr:prephenate dehydrogenase [Acidobacteriota bacterium]